MLMSLRLRSLRAALLSRVGVCGLLACGNRGMRLPLGFWSEGAVVSRLMLLSALGGAFAESGSDAG